jgi:hypothetical protein
MNQSMRQFWYIIAVLMLGAVNYWLNWMTMFEYLFLCCLFMIIIKLTDIEEKIGR